MKPKREKEDWRPHINAGSPDPYMQIIMGYLREDIASGLDDAPARYFGALADLIEEGGQIEGDDRATLVGALRTLAGDAELARVACSQGKRKPGRPPSSSVREKEMLLALCVSYGVLLGLGKERAVKEVMSFFNEERSAVYESLRFIKGRKWTKYRFPVELLPKGFLAPIEAEYRRKRDAIKRRARADAILDAERKRIKKQKNSLV